MVGIGFSWPSMTPVFSELRTSLKRDRRGQSAKSADRLDEQRQLDGPDLHAVEIRRAHDGPVRGKVPGTEILDTENANAGLLAKLVHQPLNEFSVHELAPVLVRCEGVGERGNLKFRNVILDEADERDIDRSRLDLAIGVLLVRDDRTGIEDRDLDLAGARFTERLAPPFQREGVWLRRRMNVGRADPDFGLGRSWKRNLCKDGGRDRKSKAFHVFPPCRQVGRSVSLPAVYCFG